MKKIIAMGLLGMGMMAAGCENAPIAANQAHYQPSQVSMTDWGLQQDLRVSKAGAERIGAGQLKVSVELYNNTNHDLSVDYQYSFTDKTGMGVDNPSGWQFVKVPPRGFKQFDFTSMSAMADDFRVQLRPAK